MSVEKYKFLEAVSNMDKYFLIAPIIRIDSIFLPNQTMNDTRELRPSRSRDKLPVVLDIATSTTPILIKVQTDS